MDKSAEVEPGSDLVMMGGRRGGDSGGSDMLNSQNVGMRMQIHEQLSCLRCDRATFCYCNRRNWTTQNRSVSPNLYDSSNQSTPLCSITVAIDLQSIISLIYAAPTLRMNNDNVGVETLDRDTGQELKLFGRITDAQRASEKDAAFSTVS